MSHAAADVPDLLPKAEFAQWYGRSKAWVSKMIAAGRVVMDPGTALVRVPQTLELLRATAAGYQAPEGGAAPSPMWASARERKEAAQAEMAEMEVAERRGELTPAADVRAAAVAAAVALRNGLEMLPERLAPQVAGLSDEAAIRGLIAHEVEAALTEVAHKLGQLAPDSAAQAAAAAAAHAA